VEQILNSGKRQMGFLRIMRVKRRSNVQRTCDFVLRICGEYALS
jgi:hypothetical protein